MDPGQGQKGATAEAVRSAVRRHAERSLTREQAEQLAIYLNDLLRWNRRINLVGGADWETVLTRLVLDSLFLADLLDSCSLPREPLFLDIGAGAGIPGIPYRILRSRGSYWLLEPRGKRHTFLSFVLSRLRLPETRTLNSRLQDLQPRQWAADVLISRGVTSWQRFLSMITAYAAEGSVAVAFSKEPFPRRESIPAGWALTREMSYRSSPELPLRYFWCFSARKAPS